jgi:hypothetical protein
MGRVLVAVGILSALFGLAAEALYAANAISSDTSADLGLVSLGSAAIAAILGFALRRRIRLAREGMFVGLATLGGWFLVLVYALSRDTP